MKPLLGTGLAGLEPSTYRLGGGRSIHLSYSPKVRLKISSQIIARVFGQRNDRSSPYHVTLVTRYISSYEDNAWT